MKRSGVIDAKLAGALAELGHTDRVVVCAAGLPLPPGPEVVLSGLLEELVVEGATAAEEVERNPRPHELLTANLPDLGLVPHEELKRMVAAAKLVSAPARPRPTRTSSSAAGYLSRALR